MVIQRWQSVLLLCAAVLMGCFTFASLGQLQCPDFTLNFTTMGFIYEEEPTSGGFSGTYMSTWYLFAVSLTAVLLPLINIVLYKNLRLQKRVCLVEIILIVAAAVQAAVLGYTAVEGVKVDWSVIAWCPLIALFADILAYNRIESDRRKLAAADRIR